MGSEGLFTKVFAANTDEALINAVNNGLDFEICEDKHSLSAPFSMRVEIIGSSSVKFARYSALSPLAFSQLISAPCSIRNFTAGA